MQADRPRVLVTVPTWNQRDRVLRCLDSLLKLDYPNFEIAVVDQASSDGTYESILKRCPKVHVICHRENFGFGEGVTGGLRRALEIGADFLLIVENDAVADPKALREMVEAAAGDSRIGLVFPKVLEWGSQAKIWAAGGTTYAEIDWLRGRFPGLIQEGEENERANQLKEVQFFPGGFCLVRMEAVKRAGYMNPDYFLYYDDADWQMRIYRAGFTGRYAPRAVMWHEPASTLGRGSEAGRYYETRNRLYFFKRYAPRGRFIPFFLLTTAGLFLRPDRSRLAGWFDFLRGKKRNKTFGVSRGHFLSRVSRRFATALSAWVRPFRFAIKRFLGLPLQLEVAVDWNIGDEIMTLPVYEGLKKKFPGARINARVRFPEVLRRHPFVDSINGSETDPDLVVNFHQDIRHRPRVEYLPEIAGLRNWGVPKIYLGPDEIQAARKRWGLQEGEIRIAICPEVWWFARRWPRERWIETAEYFQKKSDRLFILGTDERNFPVGENLVGQTSLREALALMSQNALFLGHDSGPLYMALAVGTPSVGLYGPLNPELLYPKLDYFTSLWSPIECRGCWPEGRMIYRDHCPKIVPDCLPQISTAEVIKAGEALLARFVQARTQVLL